jgi:N,N'-diacetyllegionaminate synthase
LVTSTADKADYQKRSGQPDQSQYEMLKQLELDRSSHEALVDYCKNKSAKFVSSAFDIDSIDLLAELNIPFFKIPSGEITNLNYLRHVGSLNKPIVMSTGIATLCEVKSALNILFDCGARKEDITLLHCNTEYPTPMCDVNLKAMTTMRDELEVAVGYSDHSVGLEVPIAAVALGATIIEKHFTLDRNLPGPDHSASLEPVELTSMVKAIRNIELALGDGIKAPRPSELKNIHVIRKSIVASRTIHAGDTFTEDNITVKRPGHGRSPMEWDNLIGSESSRDYIKDELIKE